MKPAWVPDTGDIVWLQFSPQAGHEQAGHRPALVLSPARYNDRTGLMLCVPLTSRIKGYPFEVAMSGEPPSVALSDQVRNLDWRARKAEFKGRASLEVVDQVRARIASLING